MSVELVLPLGSVSGHAGFKLVHEDTQQETILIIAGASRMSRQQLQENIQSAAEGEFARMKERGNWRLKRRYSNADIGKALKEREEWMERERHGSNKRMYTP